MVKAAKFLAATLAVTVSACVPPPERKLPSIEDYLPPALGRGGGSGGPRQVWAGRLDDASFARERIAGTASAGRIGDFYMRNARIRVIIQQPGRVIGPQPYGGNIIDADLVGGAGGGAGNDRLGEVGIIYGLGRTFDFRRAEILADGSGGGAAALRFRGDDAVNDYINVRGLGAIPIAPDRSPDEPIPFDGAVTYVLSPDDDFVRIDYTIFNRSDKAVVQPFGLLADSGSEVELWTPGRGFLASDFTGSLSALTNPARYAVIQGPGVAYGLYPRFIPPPKDSGLFLLGGTAFLLFGSPDIFGLLGNSGELIDLPPRAGGSYSVDLVVGRDAAAVTAVDLATQGVANPARVAVTLSSAAADRAPAVSPARIFAFDEADRMAGYADVGPSDGDGAGAEAARLVLAPGRYVLRGAAPDGSLWSNGPADFAAGDSARIVPLRLSSTLLHVSAVDAATGRPLPARVTVISGAAGVDPRYGGVFEQTPGIHAERFLDPHTGELPAPIALPGAAYRVVVSAGPEWSRHVQRLSPSGGGGEARVQTVAASLRRVVDTRGYLACDFHQHSVASPDCSVAMADRLRSYLAAGIELFASSDHDVLVDYRPLIHALKVEDRVASIVGVEATPFDYGHFNFFPLDPVPDEPTFGALDWAGGTDGLCLPPADIFERYRSERGARIVQVNHPRGPGGSGSFQAYFDRAALTFDFAGRVMGGARAQQPIPNQVLRLPDDRALWSPTFDTLEIWTGLEAADTNGDGVLEQTASDRTLRDWFSLLSFGFLVTGVGNSDTHALTRSPAGMPRTYVRVPDDSEWAIRADPAPAVLRTLRGDDGVPRDVIVSNGPFVRVRAAGTDASAIGSVIPARGGSVALDIEVVSTAWAPISTVEVFANQTPDALPAGAPSALIPTACFTARVSRQPADTCDAAPLGGAQALQVAFETVAHAPGAGRWRARARFTAVLADLPRRSGARGDDAWIVVRALGTRALYPEVPAGVVTSANGAVLAAGDDAAFEATLERVGVAAQAITNPIFVDADGDGWRAPFAP